MTTPKKESKAPTNRWKLFYFREGRWLFVSSFDLDPCGLPDGVLQFFIFAAQGPQGGEAAFQLFRVEEDRGTLLFLEARHGMKQKATNVVLKGLQRLEEPGPFPGGITIKRRCIQRAKVNDDQD